MDKRPYRALVLSALMILTSLAGCIESSDESSDDTTDGSDQGTEYYGTIMTSTYHVEQLVSAIVGDTANVEMMSTSNMPVHDYRPSTQDLERLRSSEVFFYHGLDLEPWVQSAITSDGAPPSYMTHTMPSGEVTLDYQTMLLNDLCEQLAEGDKVSNTLLSYEDQAEQLEIHPEKGVQTLTFPEADTSHEGHDHDDHDGHDDHDDHDSHGDDGHDDHDDHDSHSDDGHDDHGDHEEEHHGLAILYPDNTSMVFETEHDDLPENASGWNLTTTALDANSISYTYEDSSFGAYIVGINGVEAPAWGSVSDEDYWYWSVYVWNETGDTWDVSNVGLSSVVLEDSQHVAIAASNADTTLIPTGPEDHDDHGDDGHDDHGDGGHDDHGDHDDHDGHGAHDDHAHAEAEKVFENPVGCPANTVVSVFHLGEGEHIIEFETDWWARTTFDMVALPMMGGHDHAHGHHDDHDDHDDHGDEANHDEDGDHADDHGDEAGHDEDGDHADDHGDEAGHDEDGDHADDHGDEAGHDEDGDSVVIVDEDQGDGHDDEDGHDEDGHDDHGDDGHDDHGDEHGGHADHGNEGICHAPDHTNTNHTNREDCEAAGNIWMVGEPNDGTRGYLTIHVEKEGDYGFAVPSDISVFILAGEGHEGHDHGSHDDHDDHDDHGDAHDEDGHDEDGHGDAHDEDGHDEDDHGDAHDEDGHDEGDGTIVADDDEEEFDYDPHSWLDPVSFKAQAELVLSALIEVFPNGTETFTANANAFMAELDEIHVGYTNAFGPSGTCTNKIAAANHNAYSYITERYGVEFVTVHGLDPEGEPTVEGVENVIAKINEDAIAVIYIEEYTQASSVDLIVEATGVQVLYLYTMEKAPSDPSDDYLTMMNKNLDNLKSGLGCAV